MRKDNRDFPDFRFHHFIRHETRASRGIVGNRSHPPGLAAESAKVPDRHPDQPDRAADRHPDREPDRLTGEPSRRILPEPATGVYGTRYGPGRRAYRIPGHRAQDRTWRFRGVESRSRAGTVPESSRVPSRNRTAYPPGTRQDRHVARSEPFGRIGYFVPAKALNTTVITKVANNRPNKYNRTGPCFVFAAAIRPPKRIGPPITAISPRVLGLTLPWMFVPILHPSAIHPAGPIQKKKPDTNNVPAPSQAQKKRAHPGNGVSRS